MGEGLFGEDRRVDTPHDHRHPFRPEPVGDLVSPRCLVRHGGDPDQVEVRPERDPVMELIDKGDLPRRRGYCGNLLEGVGRELEMAYPAELVGCRVNEKEPRIGPLGGRTELHVIWYHVTGAFVNCPISPMAEWA